MIAAGLSQAVLIVLLSAAADPHTPIRAPLNVVEQIPMPSLAACQAEATAVGLEKHVLHAFCVDQQERAR